MCWNKYVLEIAVSTLSVVLRQKDDVGCPEVWIECFGGDVLFANCLLFPCDGY